MNEKYHCPVIHGALVLNLKHGPLEIRSCCLREVGKVKSVGDIWSNPALVPLREFNKNNAAFDVDCWNCESLEKNGLDSYRTGMLQKHGIKFDRKGPARIDIMFDMSCNLACRICGPDLSTFWRKHMKQNNVPIPITVVEQRDRTDEMIDHLKSLDLSELTEVVFCGGETMMGTAHWRVAEALTKLVPNAKKQLQLQFQTNGTIPLTSRHYEIIEKFQIVKFLVSADGIKDQFEYLRWPAKWDQFTANVAAMIKEAPVNVMFNLEETLNIFNLFYQDRIDNWAKENFYINRLGDPILHCKHIVHGTFSLDNLTQEYIDAIQGTSMSNYVKITQQENTIAIRNMINTIQLEDQLRKEDWTKTFPEVAEFYKRYI